jgi:hypothetical protein
MKFGYSNPYDNDREIKFDGQCSRKTGWGYETEKEFPVTRL